ncbi:MAG: prepilin peptidase [Bdellovibrionales bacterium]|nr:prepilin peptidase [Bdellovibrionales bacterium]
MIAASVIILGLIIGSFLSVCIFRIPYGRSSGLEELLEQEDSPEGESDLVEPPEKPQDSPQLSISNPPRSFCPTCKVQLLWWHNIPVVSWIILRGRCANCSARISVRYPLVELLSAASAFGAYFTFGPTLSALVIYIFLCALIVISFIDIDYYIIPNVISLPGTLIGISIAVLNQFSALFKYPIVPGILDSLLGILAGAGFLLLISEGYFRLRKREGLGMGDVKLLAMVGALFGVAGSLYTIFVGSVLGSVLGILFIVLGGKKFSQHLPFGPYLALGTVLYIFAGPESIRYVLSYMMGMP